MDVLLSVLSVSLFASTIRAATPSALPPDWWEPLFLAFSSR